MSYTAITRTWLQLSGLHFLSSNLSVYQVWTKEETDQLFDLCERFDLRFIVIADRFPLSRTVEELKDRYYSGNVSTIDFLFFFKWRINYSSS